MSMIGWAYQTPEGKWVFNDSFVKPDGWGPNCKWQSANLELSPATKTVFQWRYKNAEQKHWKLAKSLLTRTEAKEYFLGCDIEEHAGPFEVASD